MEKKKFYYIGDLSRMVSLPAHILRYWEKEFTCIKPIRDGKGNRLYTERDASTIRHIKSLVYDRGFSIRGAKKELREESPRQLLQSNKNFLKSVLREVRELKKCLR